MSFNGKLKDWSESPLRKNWQLDIQKLELAEKSYNYLQLYSLHHRVAVLGVCLDCIVGKLGEQVLEREYEATSIT